VASFFSLFRIRRDERIPALVALLVILVFNYLIISKFYCLFADYYRPETWRTFMRNFHMSGFDPITYDVVSTWRLGYNIIRHPLLPFFMLPLWALNQLLWWLTGVNCVQFVVGALLVFCSFWSFIFLHRILREVVGVRLAVANVLAAMFFGFAYVLVAIIVPDHFCLSLFLLLLTLYRAGIHLKGGSRFGLGEAVVLFFFTSGVTLSNGLLVLWAVFVVNGRQFFSRRFFVSLLLLSLLMLGFGVALDAMVSDPGDKQVAEWVDARPPLWGTIVENFFGESIQLHRKHILGDVLVTRPVIVAYTWRAQYVVEAVLVALFACGVWCGRRSRFLWLSVGCMGYSVLLHLVVGFAASEVYIMACHWIYVIPIACAFLFTSFHSHETRSSSLVAHPFTGWALFVVFLAITAYLWIYHSVLLHRYLTWPLIK
jgi:hypothetical protein